MHLCLACDFIFSLNILKNSLENLKARQTYDMTSLTRLKLRTMVTILKKKKWRTQKKKSEIHSVSFSPTTRTKQNKTKQTP